MSIQEKVKLVLPAIEFKDSYLSYMEEFKNAGEELIPFPLEFSYADFEKMVNRLERYSQGIGLDEGLVPHTTFWLIESDKTIVGVSNLRHSLTDALRDHGGHIGYSIRPSSRGKGYGKTILKESLVEAQKLGIKRVLVTCDKENERSQRTIFGCGGIFDSESYVERCQSMSRRFWISLD